MKVPIEFNTADEYHTGVMRAKCVDVLEQVLHKYIMSFLHERVDRALKAGCPAEKVEELSDEVDKEVQKITNDAISNLTWKLETLSKEN